MANIDKEQSTSPIGRGYFCYLNRPDKGFGKPRWSVRLRLYKGTPETAQWLQSINNEYKKWIKTVQADSGKRKVKLGKSPFTAGKDAYGEYEEIHAYQDCEIKGRDGQTIKMSIDVFDSTCMPLKNVPTVGDGSRVKISYLLSRYNSPSQGIGIRFILRGVQIIELISMQETSRDMFTKVEGGWQASGGLVAGTPVVADDVDEDGYPIDMDEDAKVNLFEDITDEDIDIDIKSTEAMDKGNVPIDGADF